MQSFETASLLAWGSPVRLDWLSLSLPPWKCDYAWIPPRPAFLHNPGSEDSGPHAYRARTLAAESLSLLNPILATFPIAGKILGRGLKREEVHNFRGCRSRWGRHGGWRGFVSVEAESMAGKAWRLEGVCGDRNLWLLLAWLQPESSFGTRKGAGL